MAKKRKQTLTSDDLFLPVGLKGLAKVCVTSLETGVTYCGKVGRIYVKETHSHTVKGDVVTYKPNERD